jgi:hypothetical protein
MRFLHSSALVFALCVPVLSRAQQTYLPLTSSSCSIQQSEISLQCHWSGYIAGGEEWCTVNASSYVASTGNQCTSTRCYAAFGACVNHQLTKFTTCCNPEMQVTGLACAGQSPPFTNVTTKVPC